MKEPVVLEELTEELIKGFWNRKQHRRLSLVVDVENETTYLIPDEIEHRAFRQTYFRDADYTKFIPVHIDFDLNEVEDRGYRIAEYTANSIEIGKSGVEQADGIKHTYDCFKKAEDIVAKLFREYEKPNSTIIIKKGRNAKVRKYTEQFGEKRAA